MKHHACAVPPPGETRAPGSARLIDRWQCPEPECHWRWRLNPIVLHWFRDIPDHPTGYP